MGDEGAWLAPLFSSFTSSLSKEVMFPYQLLSLSPFSHHPRATDPGGEEIHGKGHGLQWLDKLYLALVSFWTCTCLWLAVVDTFLGFFEFSLLTTANIIYQRSIAT